MSQQPQQTLPSAPNSPALVVSSNVQKYAIKKKKVLSAEEAELFELTQAAGIIVDQEVFKIILDLLKMNVAPQAVFHTLKAMCAGQRVVESCSGELAAAGPYTAGITPAPAEARAVRSKAGASHSEKSKEASSQRVQRQSSATRGQKTKSSTSSSSSSQMNST